MPEPMFRQESQESPSLTRTWSLSRRIRLSVGALLIAGSTGTISQPPGYCAEPLEPGLSAVASHMPVYEWRAPLARPRGVIVAVHGTTQQGGCFASLARILNAEGFTVIAMDLRGHGRWYFRADKRGGRHEVSYNRSAEDLAYLAIQLRAIYPKQPLFCIGESVGAVVTIRACEGHPDLFDGIILASSGSTPHIFSLSWIAKDFVKGITDLDRPLDVTKYITRYSSEDPRITQEMVTDPLSRTMLTGKEILQTGAFIRKAPQFAEKLPANLAVLFLQGTEDHIVKPHSIDIIMDHMTSHDKHKVEIPDCGHLLLGTAYLKPSVVNPLTDWLIEQTSTKHTAHASLLPRM